MNLIFFSPNFPRYSTEFCFHLKKCGINVLGIGDAEYHTLNDKLKQSLTEYKQVDDLNNYDDILRWVGYYTYKYGKIDRFESLNEHWLGLEAQIRTDFNIYGTKLDFIANLKLKSKMETFFKKSDVKTIQSLTNLKWSKAKKFAEKVGFPLVIKPDQGSGASMTYKINNVFELEHFLIDKPSDVEFILQEYIDGIIQTYDGLVNKDGKIVFAASHEFPQSIMEAVNSGYHISYYCLKEVSKEIEEAGSKIIHTYGIKERFFHIEFFKSNVTGKIIALEVNMRPPGTWMIDAINYTHDMDIYKQWAHMVVYNRIEGPYIGKYYTGFASRKNHIHYVHGHVEIMQYYWDKMVNYGKIEDAISLSRGNYAYQFRSTSLEEVKEIIDFIQAVDN